MTQLIVFRAVQGVGGGALFTTAFAIIADMYEPRERGKFSGVFGSVFGLASVIGPVIGGFFTEHGTVQFAGHVIAGWRWVFYLNLPLSALSLFMIIAKMPRLIRHGGTAIDFAGAALIILGFVPLLLAMSWGGQDYPWGSPQIVGLFAFGAAALVAFGYIETKVREPIMPMELFANRTFSLTNAAVFIVGMAFMGAVTFLPLFMQVGLGAQATASGLAMLPLMIGIIGGSTTSGLLVSRTGRFKPFMIAGGLVMTAGVVSMIFISPTTSLPGLGWRVLIIGLGLGGCQNLFGLAAQNAVPPHRIGVTTSSSMFFRQIGSTIGVALFGALLTHDLTAELARRAPVEPAGAHQAMDIARLQAMALSRAAAGGRVSADARSPAMIKATGDAFAASMINLFEVALVTMLVAVVLIILVPALPMRSRSEAPGPAGR